MEILVPEAFKYLYVTNKARPIVKIPHPVLRERCRPVEKAGPKVLRLIDAMTRALRDANGVGLAAPQMASTERIVVVAPQGSKPVAMINPVITAWDGEEVAEEGCLSIPGLYGDVARAARIEVEAFDKRGRPLAYELEGMAARIVQHEVDHLDGVLFIDKAVPESLHWMHPDPDRVPAG
jgi:peptide deformylase